MGEKLSPEYAPVQTKTLKLIQNRIRTLVDKRIYNPEVEGLRTEDMPPTATFRMGDHPNPEKAPKISASIDIGNIVTIEIPVVGEEDERISDMEESTTSGFKRLSIKFNSLMPRVHSAEEGYYETDGEEVITSVEDSLTEAKAQEFLTFLNKANEDNEIDIYGLTRKEREANKEKADILRNVIDKILGRAKEEGNLEEEQFETPEGIQIGELARVMVGDTKFVVLRNKTYGHCVVDIQGDMDFTRLLGDDDQDDPDQTVRPRIHNIILSENSFDRRIFSGLIYDPVEYGEPIINPPDDFLFMERSENVATEEEKRQLYLKLDKVFKEGHILPPVRRSGGESLQEA